MVVGAASGLLDRSGIVPGRLAVAAVMMMRFDLGNFDRSVARSHMPGVSARNRGQKETDNQHEPCRKSHAGFSG